MVFANLPRGILSLNVECSTLSWSYYCCKESSVVCTSNLTGCLASEMVQNSMETRLFSSSLKGGASLGLLSIFSFSRTDTTIGSYGLDFSLRGRYSSTRTLIDSITALVILLYTL